MESELKLQSLSGFHILHNTIHISAWVTQGYMEIAVITSVIVKLNYVFLEPLESNVAFD